jgi:signal transduction histidine kinase
MGYELQVRNEDGSERIVPVDGELVVGRAPTCELAINDPRLSRRHARFFLEEGDLHVEDLGSPNGTLVNGQRIGRARLRAGDSIIVGKTELKVASPDSVTLLPDTLRDQLRPELRATFVKPIQEITPPALEGLPTADEYFTELGIGDETLVEDRGERLARLLRRTRSFAVLHEVNKVIQSEHDPIVLLDRALGLLLKVTHADVAHAALLDESARPMKLITKRRDGRAPKSGEKIQLSRTVSRHVVDDRSAVICADASRDARFQRAESLMVGEVRALMAAPMVAGERVIGLIEVLNTLSHADLGESELELLSLTASSLGVAIEKMRTEQQLAATQERLVRTEQLAAIGRLAAGIAHEVKNHLSPFTLADMLAKRHPDDAQLQDAAEMMHEAQQHILDLVNEIRSFAGGALAPRELAPLDLAEVVESVLRFMKHDSALRRAKMKLEIVARPVVELDARSFRQVLINLIKNACDALPEKGGAVEVRIRADDDRAVLEVIDNGSGIPREIAEHIFEPFFSTKGDKGLGLGLDISRKIVADHGGELSFTSEPDAGTTFRVSLPITSG